MMKNFNQYFFISILITIICSSCKESNSYEKKHDYSTKVIDIKGSVHIISTDRVFGMNNLNLIGNYIIITDQKSLDEGFLFFDKNTFNYLGSGGKRGQGPGEIVDYTNTSLYPTYKSNNTFLAVDYSQSKIYKYNIDSLLNDQNYLPEKQLNMYSKQLFRSFIPINDSIYIANSIKITGHKFINEPVKININTGGFLPFGYQNPYIINLSGSNTHSFISGSFDNDIIVTAYYKQDLLTIMDLDGNLICNVYGADWNYDDYKGESYFHNIYITKQYIFASYKDGQGLVEEAGKRPRGPVPKKIIVLNHSGDYIKTLDLDEEFKQFAVDETNNRIIISFYNRDQPLAYINISEVLEK